MTLRILRLGWLTGAPGNVVYDARGNEWWRLVGPFWWMVVRAR